MTSSTLYYIKSKKALKGIALGYYLHGKSFRVLAGSAVRYPQTEEFETGNGTYSRLYEKLLNADIIRPNKSGRGAVLTQDYIFDSISASSSIINGRQCNGSEWKPLNVEE